MEPSTVTSIIDSDRLHAVRDVAQFLGISPADVYKLTYRGDLPVVHVGARVRIAESALREYLQTHTVLRAAEVR